MKYSSILAFLFLPFFLFSQETEKRLALVIGNSNYDKGELKNPVNDARLIASTLDSLDFDVILKENLSTKRDMTAAIREFGSKRSEYDVAFVYYAGHGIQVDDENFLLPTKEVFEGEFDVLDYGVSVQNIMRYLRAQTNQVNILILDACRDNPFESKWNATRSLKSQGLAKIPPPTGSLIAFSTDSGQTAPDGDGENSVYTVSLAKNMLLKNTSIDQVFRNVRAEVLEKTNGNQRPVEATQLTGQTFYFTTLSINKFAEAFDNALISGDYDFALDISFQMLNKYPSNSISYVKSGHIRMINNNYSKARELYQKALELDPYNIQALSCELFKKDNENITLGLLEVLLKIAVNQGDSSGEVQDVVGEELNKLIKNNIFLHELPIAYYLVTKASGGIPQLNLDFFLFRLDIASKAYDLSLNDSVLNDFFESNSIYDKIKAVPASIKAILCSQIASIYIDIIYAKKQLEMDYNDELLSQLKYANKAINHEMEEKIEGNGICYLYNLKAKGLIIQEKFKEAKEIINISLDNPKNNKDSKITSFYRLSAIYSYLNEHEKSNYYSKKALELTFLNNPNQRTLFNRILNTAAIHFVNENYLKSFSYVEQLYNFEELFLNDGFYLLLRTLVLKKLDGDSIFCEEDYKNKLQNIDWDKKINWNIIGETAGGYTFWQKQKYLVENIKFSCE